MGGGTEETFQTDSSSSTRVYIKIIYENNIFQRGSTDYNMYKFTSISGKVVRLDSSVQLVKLEINEAGQGPYYNDIYASTLIGRGNLYASAVSNYPSNDVYYLIPTVIPYYFNVDCGGTSTAYLKAYSTGYFTRAGTSWNYTVTILKTS